METVTLIPDPNRTSLLQAVNAAAIERLPHRFRRLARFGLSGVLSTLLYFVLVNAIVLAFRAEPVWASVCAYLLALGFSYLMQSRFTFRAGGHSGTVLRFVLTSGAGLAISYGTMWLFSTYFALPYVTGAAVVCLLLPAANYLVFKYWVFAGAPNGSDRLR